LIKAQQLATTAFEAGVEEYDRKQGYRGPLTKIDTTGNWQEQLRDHNQKTKKM
jgi:penicillin-binding protein 1A